jgi:hypothetical protein
MWGWLLLAACILLRWGLTQKAHRGGGSDVGRAIAPLQDGGAEPSPTTANVNQIEDARSAETSPVDGERASVLVVARPHQVGYRRIEFRFANPAGEQQTRQLDVWYPTQEQEKRHDYRGQIGRAAAGAAVAPGPHPLVVFSHGFLGSSDQSIFLTEACARAG